MPNRPLYRLTPKKNILYNFSQIYRINHLAEKTTFITC